MRVEGREMVREQITPGKMMPLDRGAPGHILTRYTAPNPPAAPEIVVSLWERNPEIAGVAVPVFGVRQVFVGALVGSGTVARFSAPGRLEAMKQAVYAHARQLTVTLGGDPAVYDRPGPGPGPGQGPASASAHGYRSSLPVSPPGRGRRS
jgi:DNA-binding IclR family transcriptional regulator